MFTSCKLFGNYCYIEFESPGFVGTVVNNFAVLAKFSKVCSCYDYIVALRYNGHIALILYRTENRQLYPYST